MTMAVRHIPHPSLAPLLPLLLSVTLLTGHVTGQVVDNEVTGHGPESPSPQKDSLEETVIAELLRIVDQKFDSLSARISGLERSVNSLNFYSVRQFRDISDSLQGTTAAVDTLSGQLTKVEKDHRALKVAVTQSSRNMHVLRTDVGVVKADVKVVKSDVGTMKEEVDVLKSDSLKMFEDIANSIIYFNENVGEKTEELKTLLQQAVSTAEQREASEKEESSVLRGYLQDLDLHTPRNCSVNFRPLEERIDLRFAEMKRQTHIHFVDLIHAGPRSQQQQQQQQQGEGEGQGQGEGGRQALASSETPQSLPHVAEEDGGGPAGGAGEEEGELVMRLLANMTQNVLEAVAYFRHTGSMMERLLHTTITMKEEQSRLRSDLEASRLLSSGHTEGAEMLDNLLTNLPQGRDLHGLPGLHPDPSDLSPRSQEQESNVLEPVNGLPSGPLPAKKRPEHPPASRFIPSGAVYGVGSQGGESSASAGGMTEVVEESLRVLAELTRNGSQLLDVLTDLAQLSATSLTHSVGALQTQVQRLDDVLLRFNEGLLSSGTASSDLAADAESSVESGGDLRSLQNTTKTIFSLVEAMASNTGWIPYIFHKVQHVERLANRSLQLTQRALLLPPPQGSGPRGGRGEVVVGGGGTRGAVNQSQTLQSIYHTSVQLQRILPALTRLVAEPEPLMALTEGSTSQEGRVEIFYKGRWGSVCRLDMGHAEASAVCKYLGFAGGVWAGAGHFAGVAEGRHWLLNVSCLYSQACPLVVPLQQPLHCPAGHFAVICDHMLRMTPIPGVSDVKTGLVSIHHQGRWLPVCSHGWSGYEARVACKQMGFLDGREFLQDGMPWREVVGEVERWVYGVGCTGDEGRLDACQVDTYSADQCRETASPAAVRCQ